MALFRSLALCLLIVAACDHAPLVSAEPATGEIVFATGGCSRTVLGKDIIDTSASNGGDLSMESGLNLDACCRTCSKLSVLGCKAVVWNTGDCFFKTITGPLVNPGQGTAHEGSNVTAGFP